jgi:Ca2+-transporting ATPase
LLKKLQFNLHKIKENNPEKTKIPFNTSSKLMATLNKSDDGYTVYAKGAFESIINYCNTILKDEKPQEFNNKTQWLSRIDDMASQGLRVLAFAYKHQETEPNKDDLVSDLTFIGVIGFLDPAREDVKLTINVYKEAGIKVVMMTGDHPGTAKKIAQEIGLLSNNAASSSIIHGNELQFEDQPSPTAHKRLLDASVFARVTPEQKLKLITFYQENENVVGMFGDGINDIPALRKSRYWYRHGD